MAFGADGLSLNGEWRLEYFPQPDGGAVRTLPLPAGLGVKSVAATVPGNCELDLVHAGLLPAPEIGLNTRLLRPYEGYQWLYTKTFAKPAIPTGGRAVLRFEGVDTLADYFLNGVKVGSSENMLIAHRFDVTKYLKDGENTLQVLLRSVMCESQHQTLGELGYSMQGGADGESFRKAGHMGGWDIFPRAFVSGLWRDVALDVEEAVRIDQTAWILRDFDPAKRSAGYRVRCRVQAPFSRIASGETRITARLSRKGKVVASCRHRLEGYWPNLGLYFGNADLWWPAGMGESALYDATIDLTDKDGAILASHTEKIGVRRIELVRDDVYSKERPGQFLFKVNGEPCYVRGSNWVPLDSFHGRDGQFLTSTLEMWTDLNCNMVRVWGGGVYEPDAFFDYCDAHGIMVWQDFMTGCSVFPQNDAYAKMTEEEIRAIVLKFRNRASLALWSGNNENDGAFRWQLGGLGRDPNHDRNSRRTIADVLYEFDVTRPYLPSSPYYSPDVAAGKAKPSEEHLWGARAYYKVPFYTNSPSWFASEMGYHGCANRASLEKMMTKGCVYPWTNAKERFVKNHRSLTWNDEWAFKASDWQLGGFGQNRNHLMTNQVRLMFGGVDTDLDAFVEQSQIIQAEAMKTFCELFRSRKFRRMNGLIWWNVRDGWPQLSDAVVDYYGGKKKAYFALKNVQRNQLVCVTDDREVWAVNDTLAPVSGHVRITDAATGKVALDTDWSCPRNAAAKIGTVDWAGQGLLDIAYAVGGKAHYNWFLYGDIPFDAKAVVPLLRKAYERIK